MNYYWIGGIFIFLVAVTIIEVRLRAMHQTLMAILNNRASRAALIAGFLVSSTITYIYPVPGQPAQQISICRYSDGLVLTVPGFSCPGSD